MVGGLLRRGALVVHRRPVPRAVARPVSEDELVAVAVAAAAAATASSSAAAVFSKEPSPKVEEESVGRTEACDEENEQN